MIADQIDNLQALREYLQDESSGDCCSCPQTQIING